MNKLNKKSLLSLDDCNVLRGIAIIGIFLHNFCHWLPGIVKENEYIYDISRPHGLFDAIKAFSVDLPLHLISFFGHYGVPIFLFLSAFGLEMKYNNSSIGAKTNDIKDIWRFSRYHFLKLFKLLFVGYVTFLVLHYMYDPNPISSKRMLLQLGMVINMLKNSYNGIFPGPYWFFGLMIQLYVFYRVVLYKRHWGYTVGSILLFTLLQIVFINDQKNLEYYRYNFMGSVLPFGLGILYARYGDLINMSDINKKTKNIIIALVLILSAALIFWFSFYFVTWIWIPALVCIFSLCLVKVLNTKYMKQIYSTLLWFGSISSALFIAHPTARIIFINVSKHENIYTGLIIYIMSSIALAWVFNEILKKIPNPKY